MTRGTFPCRWFAQGMPLARAKASSSQLWWGSSMEGMSIPPSHVRSLKPMSQWAGESTFMVSCIVLKKIIYYLLIHLVILSTYLTSRHSLVCDNITLYHVSLHKWHNCSERVFGYRRKCQEQWYWPQVTQEAYPGPVGEKPQEGSWERVLSLCCRVYWC